MVNGTTPVLMQGHVRRAVLSVGMLIIYLAAHIGVPLLCHHPVRALFFFSCYIGGTGLLFGLSSAINHMTPASIAVEPTPKADGAAASSRGPLAMAEPSPARLLQQHSWAARQAVASNNFCLSSSLAFWLSNALNYQVEPVSKKVSTSYKARATFLLAHLLIRSSTTCSPASTTSTSPPSHLSCGPRVMSSACRTTRLTRG